MSQDIEKLKSDIYFFVWSMVKDSRCNKECGIQKGTMVQEVCHCKIDNGWVIKK